MAGIAADSGDSGDAVGIGRSSDPVHPQPASLDPDLPDGSAYGIRISLTDVKGISEAEVARIVAGQPFHSLADFWNRAHVSRPVTERLVLAGGFDTVYGIDTIGAGVDPGHAHRPRHRGVRAAHAPEGGGRGARGYGSADWAHGEAGDDGDYSGYSRWGPQRRRAAHGTPSPVCGTPSPVCGTPSRVCGTPSRVCGTPESDDGAGPHDGPLTTLTSAGLGRRGRVTRRDLLLHVAELDRWSRATAPSGNRVRTGTAAPSAPVGSARIGTGLGHGTCAGTDLVRRRRADRDRRARLGVGRQGAEPAGQPRPTRSPLTVDRPTSGREHDGFQRGGFSPLWGERSTALTHQCRRRVLPRPSPLAPR